ncbi:major type 1 subunit fimbrin (pilin) [Acinetobacter calcoaceticus]|uniref:Major type 1 subunit fimbrin (Pilin) n=1 Tax=Acinetobacter calcoaceticus TaxID=471 RepID=A0A4R1XX11_ACICA|nr:major type 1 subunit fimbrin (pilin) [Acinetobacter calcoaceticus]
MKKLKALVAVSALLAPLATFAAPTVTFQGEVTDQTCEASINGGTNGNVLLPTVPSSSLAADGQKAGLTPFTIEVSNCTAPATSALKINTRFLGHAVTTNGNLGNIAETNPAANVAIQVTEQADGVKAVSFNGVTDVAGLELPVGETSTSHEFAAQYIAEGGAASAGAVKAVVEYTLSYQ